jgi:hypothetical protein
MRQRKAGPQDPATPVQTPATSGDVAGPTVDALLDPSRVMWGSVPEDRLASSSEEAAREFKRTKNPMFALYAAKLAAEGQMPLPRNVAQWLSVGIGCYLHGRHAALDRAGQRSLDRALGLKQPGHASPMRIKEDFTRKAALGRMLHLQLLGATIPDAALLVSRLSPDHTRNTLESLYRRGGYTSIANAIKEARHSAEDPESTLAEYPDRPPEVMQAKAAIRSMYAKRRP